MAENNLPSNMGKKIADALRKQGKQTKDSDDENIIDMKSEDIDSEISELYSEIDTEFKSKDDESAYDDLDMYDTPSYSQAQETEDYAPIFKMDSGEISDNPDFKLNIDVDEDTEEFEMPNNINVLKRLISQLPTGVSKQTGAQIIRQTIEALGIPMKSVLQDAQRVKECLNGSIKDCSYTIQEYKSNIRNLEKQSLSYQKQLAKLNDIISLFVYTDKK